MKISVELAHVLQMYEKVIIFTSSGRIHAEVISYHCYDDDNKVTVLGLLAPILTSDDEIKPNAITYMSADDIVNIRITEDMSEDMFIKMNMHSLHKK